MTPRTLAIALGQLLHTGEQLGQIFRLAEDIQYDSLLRDWHQDPAHSIRLVQKSPNPTAQLTDVPLPAAQGPEVPQLRPFDVYHWLKQFEPGLAHVNPSCRNALHALHSPRVSTSMGICALWPNHARTTGTNFPGR